MTDTPRPITRKEQYMSYFTGNTDWTIKVRTVWKPYHSRSPEWALPWEQPTGAHDMYKAGEYMVWTDGLVYECKEDTNFSPVDNPSAWGKVNL